MIQTAAVLALTLLTQQPVDKPTLELYQQRFVVRTPSELVRVPIVEFSLPPPAVMYRRNDAYAVWDERGLTARNGKWSFTTRLAELPVNAKLQSRQEILRTVELVKKGERKLEAYALSGSRRVGNRGFFLVRWEDKSKKPWLEALVSIDLTVDKPKPKLEGAFAGLSLANQPIDDRLGLRSGDTAGLAVPINTDAGWGYGTFDPESNAFGFRQMGDKLLAYLPLAADQALVTEQTSYGSSIAARLDGANKTLILESHGPLRFVDAAAPELLIVSSPLGRTVYWASTGAEMKIRPEDEVRRAGRYVLVWSPARNPREARLYDPARWELLASWRLM